MAACYKFTCNKCGFAIESWDEGNPYIEYPKGQRQYYYHPEESDEIERIASEILGHFPTRPERDAVLHTYGGNAANFICRECESLTKLDPEVDPLLCASCGSSNILETRDIAGKKCIRCDGTFSQGEFAAIS